MKGFVYDGKSTEDILDVPLMLATFESQDSIQGVSKTDNIGNQTITRESPNEYGTINTLPSFTYGLIKSDKTCFTDEEQRIVEAWLTSPRFSQELYLFDFDSVVCSLSNDIDYEYVNGRVSSLSDSLKQIISFSYDSDGKLIAESDGNGNTITYIYANNLLVSSTDKYGTTNYVYDDFDNLTQIVYPNGEISYYIYNDESQLIKSIESSNHIKNHTIDLSNQNYFYKGRFVETEWYLGGNGWAGIMFTFACATAYPYRKYYHSYDISGDTNVKINCQTDDHNSYVYPILKFSNAISSDGLVKDFNFTLKSITDNNSELKAIVQNGITISLDCRNCIPWKYLNEENVSRSECAYSDLGWSDIGNIYWARLLYGNNDWIVTGNGVLTVEYNSPYKKVGGWL